MTKLQKLIAATIRAIPMIVMMALLLCIHCIFDSHGDIVTLFKLLQRSSALCIVLGVAATRHRVLRVTLSAVLGILLFVNIYCAIQLHCLFNSSVLFLILQTDTHEAGEYLSQYIFSRGTAISMVTTLAIIAAGLIANRRWQQWCNHRLDSIAERLTPSVAATVTTAIVALFTLSLLTTFTPNFFPIIFAVAAAAVAVAAAWALSRRLAPRWLQWTAGMALVACTIAPYYLPFSSANSLRDKLMCTPQSLALAITDICENDIDINRLTATNTVATASTDARADYKLVVIIGESFNRLHSSLYGYCHDTNPRLCQELDSGNLIVFTDAHTHTQGTALAMRGIFSTHLCDVDTTKWEDSPLFPVLLRKAGYTVALVDNHGTQRQSDAWQFHSSAFFSTPAMSDLCFDMRNDSIADYDMETVDRYIDRAAQHDVAIFHLMGQHSSADSRYPADFARFTPDDYADRADLDKIARLNIAAYDNATLYNDAVVAAIIDCYRDDNAIILYFSDHGEAVYDDLDFYGRILDPETPAYDNSVFRVPFVVWMSDRALAAHPDIADAIRRHSTERLDTYNVSHIVLDLLNVNTPALVPSRSWQTH